MKNKLNHIVCICLLFVIVANSQDQKVKKANKDFENFEYSKAILKYENLVDKGNASPEIHQKLGDANYLNANYEESAKWYGMLADSDSEHMDVEHTYRYAQSLRSIEKYQESNQVMEKLSQMTQNDQRVLAFLNSLDYIDKIKKNSGKYSIENLAINSTSSDFAPSVVENRLIFSTSRDTSDFSKRVHTWNRKRFLSLFSATITEDGSLSTPVKFTKSLNTQVHESSTAFTGDGKTIYFTRNNEESGKFSRDKKGISRLKIYSANLENGEWKNIVPLPFNNDDYSVAHPTLNKEENKLYFSSDMPGSLGKSDIYVVEIFEDGTFGVPQNLGRKINTESKETFPFVTDEDVLYFASDGHPGLGGMDVFATDLNNINTGYVVNVGEPINSIADDFSFVIDATLKKGYFASNRINGKGDDDIYALIQIEPLKLNCTSDILGTVKDKKTDALLADANIVLLANGNRLAAARTDKNGFFKLEIDCKNSEYILIATKEDYERSKISVSKNGEDQMNVVELFLIKTNRGAPIGTDLAKYLDIDPVYFEFNKWKIHPNAEISLKKIITYLNEYPTARIEINSHTDSRASKAYNLDLSYRRANSTMEYLIKKGIAANRLSALGRGEITLTNDCSDLVQCSAEKHQENRRSTFIMVDEEPNE